MGWLAMEPGVSKLLLNRELRSYQDLESPSDPEKMVGHEPIWVMTPFLKGHGDSRDMWLNEPRRWSPLNTKKENTSWMD